MDILGIDPASAAIDGGVVGAVLEGTNWTKEHLEHLFGDKLNRVYPVLPFVVGFAFALPMSGFEWGAALKQGIQYGLWANAAWHAHRVGVKGE